jgi:hypothetical protein
VVIDSWPFSAVCQYTYSSLVSTTCVFQYIEKWLVQATGLMIDMAQLLVYQLTCHVSYWTEPHRIKENIDPVRIITLTSAKVVPLQCRNWLVSELDWFLHWWSSWQLPVTAPKQNAALRWIILAPLIFICLPVQCTVLMLWFMYWWSVWCAVWSESGDMLAGWEVVGSGEKMTNPRHMCQVFFSSYYLPF